MCVCFFCFFLSVLVKCKCYVNTCAFRQQKQHRSLLSGVDRSLASWPRLFPQDLQLWVWLSHTPENSGCTVWAPQKKWWHSAHITVADIARNLNLGPHGDRSLFPVFTLSLTVSLPVFIWHMTGREGCGETSLQSRPFWAMVSLGFGIQRPITRSQSTWADLSYPLLTECTLVQLLQKRAFGKRSSRCFHRLLPPWI